MLPTLVPLGSYRYPNNFRFAASDFFITNESRKEFGLSQQTVNLSFSSSSKRSCFDAVGASEWAGGLGNFALSYRPTFLVWYNKEKKNVNQYWKRSSSTLECPGVPKMYTRRATKALPKPTFKFSRTVQQGNVARRITCKSSRQSIKYSILLVLFFKVTALQKTLCRDFELVGCRRCFGKTLLSPRHEEREVGSFGWKKKTGEPRNLASNNARKGGSSCRLPEHLFPNITHTAQNPTLAVPSCYP